MKRSTKVELVSAVAMLLVAAMMMTSASFAWFTLSTTPEVDGVEIEMGVSKNFEIARVVVNGTTYTQPDEVTSNDALDTTDKTWGSKVTTFPGLSETDAKVNYGTHILAVGDPMSDGTTSTEKGSYAQIAYDTDGRTSGAYIKLKTTQGALNSAGVATISAAINPGVGSDVEKNVAVGYAVWLRSNTTVSSLKVTITTANATAKYAGTNGSYVSYLPTTNGSVGTSANGATSVGAALLVSVRLFCCANGPDSTGGMGSNSDSTWKAITEASISETASPAGVKYISIPGDGTEVDLTDFGGFVMEPNKIYMAVITVSINGEYLYARSYTENGLTIKGYSVTFSSADID